MAGRLHELKGSGDFTSGPTGTSGQVLYLAIGYEDQSEAEEAARILAPATIGKNIPRGSLRVEQLAQRYYRVEIDYASGIRPEAQAGAGESPPAGDDSGPPGVDSTVASRPEGPQRSPSERLGPEISFSTGGGTERIFISKETRHRIARNDGFIGGGDFAAPLPAPNFHKLIGVTLNGVEGCEIYSPQCTFTVSRRLRIMELGYFVKLFKMTATTNKKAFCGFKPGEVLFFGAEGNNNQAGETPWNLSGRFGMSPNRKKVDLDPVEGVLQIPEVGGWDYLWTINEPTTEDIGGTKYQIERPRFAYCERVYDESDFKVLKMDV